MRLGILTGGGDCPGLNAAIRAVVRTGLERGITVVGFRHGWRGVLEGEGTELASEDVRGILPRGGTILGTSGTQPSGIDGGPELVRRTFDAHALDGFIVIGGEGTMGTTAAMPDIPVVGIPKTIDNDIGGTDCQHRVLDRGADRHRFHRSPVQHRGEPQPGDGVRGHGAERRMDRHHRRSRRSGGRHLDPRASVRHRARLRADPRRASAATDVLDRGRQRGSGPRPGNDEHARVRARRERVAAPGRNRTARRRRDPAGGCAPRRA